MSGTIIALGGGGARGLAHLGILEELENAGVGIDRVVGVSIGSLLGALYAFEPDARAVQRRVLDFVASEGFQAHQTALGSTSTGNGNGGSHGFLWFDRVRSFLRGQHLFKRVTTKKSLLPGRVLEQIVDHIVPDADIADAAIPLSVVAIDLRTGSRVILEKGPLRVAIRGSSALPGIFPPVELDGKLLCDIGVHCSLPIEPARLYTPDHLIAVDVSPRLREIEGVESALDVIMRMEEIGARVLRSQVKDLADTMIRPQVGDLEWSDFTDAEGVIEIGRTAARLALQSSSLPRLDSARRSA